MKTGQRETLSFCAADKEYLIIANNYLFLLILDTLSPRDHVANLKEKTTGRYQVPVSWAWLEIFSVPRGANSYITHLLSYFLVSIP